MADSCRNIFSNDIHRETCTSDQLEDEVEPKSNYSDAKYQIDITNSTSLPTSPSRDNIVTTNSLQHFTGNSLSNSLDNISREPMVSEIEFLSTNDGNIESTILKPQSSFNSNLMMINQKRKKSNLFSSTNNYRNKVETFLKMFGDTEAVNDQLLADFSCALVKNSHSILLQGRLYITERWICFYSKIMSFENKIVLPINDIINVSKEKTARVIPNAIQITTETGKYFFTSFGSREKTFNVLFSLWQNYKDRRSLSIYEEKSIIQSCYGNEVDLFIGDDSLIDQLKDVTKLVFDKDIEEMGDIGIPSFVVGEESDTDTEPSLYSNFNQTYETGEQLLSPTRYRKKNETVLPNPATHGYCLSKQSTTSTSTNMSSADVLSNSVDQNCDKSQLSATAMTSKIKCNRFLRSKLYKTVNSNSSRQNRVSNDISAPDEFSNIPPSLKHSLNSSNNTARTINRVYSQPNLGKRMQSQSCNDHEHFQKFYLDEEVDMHVDKLFNCLFTHSSFFKRFCEFRKTFDVVQASWPEDYCVEGVKERTIYYTLSLKAKIGPKISASEEKQIVHNNSQPGLFYMVDTEVRNSGFPLSDSFHSVNRYCLIHINGSKSRIKVSSQIVYDKSLFFASKSLIESTAKSGLTDYFNDLGNALKHESRSPVHQLNVNHCLRAIPIVLDKKRSSILQTQDTQHKTTLPASDTSHSVFAEHFSYSSVGFMRTDRAWFLLIVMSLILCLCLSFLYSRFRQLEELANIQINRQHQNKYETVYDWKEVLEHQHQNQLEELSQWKLLVDNSIELIDQMKNVLVLIKNNLDKLSQEIKSNPVQFGGGGESRPLKST